MKTTLNEKFLAYLALLSGLSLSIVAEYYSILGLIAIFSAAVIPIAIMGIVLGVGKVTATLWLKQNWSIAPWSIRLYLGSAIAVLMLITSMGIFGFLSKAHSDQSLVSGDVQSKIAIYDEKIKTAKENIEANRKQLKQMDEAVDQVMARSTSEEGATKANAIRRSQQRDRSALAKDIEANQKAIASLNNEAAPIRAEVRKVEAEVGPIKYIAAFVYGDANEALLEKAVTWVIIILIVVFDPLAVILLLASQISFQNFREREDPNERELQEFADAFNEVFNDPYIADVGEKPTAEELKDDLFPTYEEITEDDGPQEPNNVVKSTSTVTTSILAQHPYLLEPFVSFKDLEPMVYHPEPKPVETTPKEYVVDAVLIDALEGTVNRLQEEKEYMLTQLEELRTADFSAKLSNAQKIEIQSLYSKIHNLELELEKATGSSYVQNEEQTQSGLWKAINSNTRITEQEYLDKIRKQNDNTDNAA